MRAEDPLLELVGVRRSFGLVEAVAGISLTVQRGEMYGLIGPDGAGKTTTLRLLLGLLPADAGTVRVLGLDPFHCRAELSRRVGYLSQRFSLYGDLSMDENIAFFAEVHGVRDWRSRRDQLLASLRLKEFRGRLADRLSGGMKQKLALACTLIHTPELLILDEPTTGVDPVSRREFWRILTDLQRDGLTLVLTTPYLDEAERCERVSLMDQGRILETNTPDVLRAGREGVLIEVLADPRRRARAWLRARTGVLEVETFGERLHVVVSEDAGVLVENLTRTFAAGLQEAGVEVNSIRVIPPSLEDAFIARIRRGQPSPPEVEG